jgi:hypothetical protein
LAANLTRIAVRSPVENLLRQAHELLSSADDFCRLTLAACKNGVDERLEVALVQMGDPRAPHHPVARGLFFAKITGPTKAVLV